MVTLQKMTPEEYQDFFQHLIDVMPIFGFHKRAVLKHLKFIIAP